MVHSIFEIVMIFDLSQFTVSRVYPEYFIRDITDHYEQHRAPQRALNDPNQVSDEMF